MVPAGAQHAPGLLIVVVDRMSARASARGIQERLVVQVVGGRGHGRPLYADDLTFRPHHRAVSCCSLARIDEAVDAHDDSGITAASETDRDSNYSLRRHWTQLPRSADS